MLATTMLHEIDYGCVLLKIKIQPNLLSPKTGRRKKIKKYSCLHWVLRCNFSFCTNQCCTATVLLVSLVSFFVFVFIDFVWFTLFYFYWIEKNAICINAYKSLYATMNEINQIYCCITVFLLISQICFVFIFRIDLI